MVRRFLHRLGAELRLWKYGLLIRRSGLFDAEFYRRQCAKDSAAQRSPVRHYLAEGAAAGLNPNPSFDTRYYLDQYPEVAASGKNALVHFIRHGAREGRVTSPRIEAADEVGRWLGADLPCRASGLERLGPGRRVLVVDQRVPSPDRDSASVRMFAILKLLRRLGHEVTFVSDALERRWRYERALRRIDVDVLRGFDATVKHLAARGLEYAVAVLSSPQAAERYLTAVRAHALRATVIYDTVDLHWVRLARAAEVTGDPVARAQSVRFRRVETTVAACADVTLTVTPEDRAALLREVPDARIEVLPNIHSPEKTTRLWGARRDLMFVGSFAHSPNVDAVVWFVERVLPLVRRELPDVVFHVAGARPPGSVKRLHSPAVRVLGHVPSLEPLFDASRVFVAPLRFGAGMKGKVGQSMSYGVPVVTTAIGAEGMMLVNGENALLADDEVTFAEAVVRLYASEELWTRVSRGSLRHIDHHFSEARAMARLASLFAGEAASERAVPEALRLVAREEP